MEIITGFAGWVIGLFLWSNIFGTLFGTLPLERGLVKAGIHKNINWPKIIFPILFAVIVIGLVAIFAKTFFVGTIVGGVTMLFNIGKLRDEALENLQRELIDEDDRK